MGKNCHEEESLLYTCSTACIVERWYRSVWCFGCMQAGSGRFTDCVSRYLALVINGNPLNQTHNGGCQQQTYAHYLDNLNTSHYSDASQPGPTTTTTTLSLDLAPTSKQSPPPTEANQAETSTRTGIVQTRAVAASSKAIDAEPGRACCLAEASAESEVR